MCGVSVCVVSEQRFNHIRFISSIAILLRYKMAAPQQTLLVAISFFLDLIEARCMTVSGGT